MASKCVHNFPSHLTLFENTLIPYYFSVTNVRGSQNKRFGWLTGLRRYIKLVIFETHKAGIVVIIYCTGNKCSKGGNSRFTENSAPAHHVAVSENKKLSYRRGTARRTVSVEFLSTATQLYEKPHLKRLTIGE